MGELVAGYLALVLVVAQAFTFGIQLNPAAGIMPIAFDFFNGIGE